MRYFGKVGYAIQVPTGLDMVGEEIVEYDYFGDVLKNNRRLEKSESVNDDLNVSNKISIVADPFAYEHFFAMKYLTWMGSKWKITDVEVDRPRLILTIGGVWNGPSK